MAQKQFHIFNLCMSQVLPLRRYVSYLHKGYGFLPSTPVSSITYNWQVTILPKYSRKGDYIIEVPNSDYLLLCLTYSC